MRAGARLAALCVAGLCPPGCPFGPAARAHTPLPAAAPASPESGRSVLNKPPQQPANKNDSNHQPPGKINPPAQVVGHLSATCKNKIGRASCRERVYISVTAGRIEHK